MRHLIHVSLVFFTLTAVAAGSHIGTPPRPGWLGFGFKSSRAVEHDRPVTWLFVQKVTPGGPAGHAGLRPGDVVVAIQGKQLQVKNDADVLLLLSRIRAGQPLDLDIVRGHQKQSVRIVAAEMDDDQFAVWQHNFALASQRDKLH